MAKATRQVVKNPVTAMVVKTLDKWDDKKRGCPPTTAALARVIFEHELKNPYAWSGLYARVRVICQTMYDFDMVDYRWEGGAKIWSNK